ncbi:hypothetical protein [Natrinema hispanicum]|nr:hypothetical protein [Natrinema hispanicum]
MPEKGLLTETDRDWLQDDEKNKSKRKNACQERVAMAMDDLKFLSGLDIDNISNLNSFGELFEKVTDEAVVDEVDDHQDAAKHLIALAYIITNDTIDYDGIFDEEILDEGYTPSDKPTDELLAFRRALSDGIKLGKDQLQDSDSERYIEEEVPDLVLVNPNTRLYETPTKDDLPTYLDKDYSGENKRYQMAVNTPDGETLSPQEVKESMALELDLMVCKEISYRHRRSDKVVKSRALEY